jgi:hypothetical protein
MSTKDVTPIMVSNKMDAFNSRTSGEDKYAYYVKIRDLLKEKAPKSFQINPGPPIDIVIALRSLPPDVLNEIYEIIDNQNE